ncbi:hypothetical protein Q4550_23540, partial [Anaerobacillus sp. 1_MG-2023]|nr:hypothetical protein [Anaerobacillus sp. 1_MG-2023]
MARQTDRWPHNADLCWHGRSRDCTVGVAICIGWRRSTWVGCWWSEAGTICRCAFGVYLVDRIVGA